VGEGAKRVQPVSCRVIAEYGIVMIPKHPFRLAVLLSGGGTTMQNLAETITRGELAAQVAVVISSRSDAYGLVRAAKLGLPCHTVERKSYRTTDAFSDPIWKLIREAGADLVCLAGFLSLLTIPEDYAWRVVNIHPALLPSFGGPGMFGHHVHEAVLAAGCKVSGCTVHFCDRRYDAGAIIAQRTCPVLDDDTPQILAARVFEQECLAYPEAVGLIAAGRVEVLGPRTRVLPTPQ
jgi:formyltetrahydrofolate-dependent phosphoribosylglycinamide formyltransferase